jgi:hypothetical protein
MWSHRLSMSIRDHSVRPSLSEFACVRRKNGPKMRRGGSSGAGKNADCGVFEPPRGVTCYKNGGENVARSLDRLGTGTWGEHLARKKRSNRSRHEASVPRMAVSKDCVGRRRRRALWCRWRNAASRWRNAVARPAGRLCEPKSTRRRNNSRGPTAGVSAGNVAREDNWSQLEHRGSNVESRGSGTESGRSRLEGRVVDWRLSILDLRIC